MVDGLPVLFEVVKVEINCSEQLKIDLVVEERTVSSAGSLAQLTVIISGKGARRCHRSEVCRLGNSTFKGYHLCCLIVRAQLLAGVTASMVIGVAADKATCMAAMSAGWAESAASTGCGH